MPVPTLLKDRDTTELRKHCEKRLGTLIDRRQPWLDFCKLVAEELLPSRLPYLIDPQHNQKGGEQNTNIFDGVGHLALDTVAAAIASGSMPQTSPWFGLVVRNEFGQDDEQLGFLDETGKRLLAMHNQSNAANVLPDGHKELVAFGTGAAIIVEDDEDGFRLDGMTVGEYCIADDHRGRVDTCYRQLTMTVGQLAEEFGYEALSDSSKRDFDNENYDVEVPCMHAIEPDRDGRNPDGDNPELPWRSVYFEQTAGCQTVLAVRGYRKFPVLVWRWGKLPGSAYGYGRGFDALPHLVRLRRLIYRHGQALAQKCEPALQIPAGMAQHEVRMLPGGKTSVFGQQEIKNLMRVDVELDKLELLIEKTKQDVRDTLGSTLVASLRRIDYQITAREADLRTTQDLTEFMPALSRLNDELNAPYVEWLYDIADQRGTLPQIPNSLADQIIDIEFTSPLARKQRQGEVDAIVETAAIAGEIAKVRPEVLDNLNVDEMIRRVAQIKGSPSATLVPLERVRALRDARAQKQQAEVAAAAAEQGAGIAKTAAEANRLQVA